MKKIISAVLCAALVAGTAWADDGASPATGKANVAAFPQPEAPQIVSPMPTEDKKIIYLSNSDSNLFFCDAQIRSIIHDKARARVGYFKEKSQMASITYLDKYATGPVGIYVTCGNDIFSIMAFPRKITQQTVYFKTSAPKTSATPLEGQEYDMRLKSAVTQVIREKLSGNAQVQVKNEKVELFANLGLTLRRVIQFDGEGVVVREFSMSNLGITTLKLDEKQFNRSELTKGADAIVVDPLILPPAGGGHLYIVEGGPDGVE